jgi:SAM-dependent methyltransferase
MENSVTALKVLDLCCGKGGWSIPFIEDGAHVVGVDIVDLGYPGHLLLEDIRNLDGHRFENYDLIIGSPPCNDFSTANLANLTRVDRRPEVKPNPARGMRLVEAFNRIVSEAKPRFWAMENVRRLEKFYPVKPIWHFRIGRGAHRSLWGNLPIPLAPEFRFHNRIHNSRRAIDAHRYPAFQRLMGKNFAMIPYPITRFIADCVKHQIEVSA